ncbi:hypothetical protein [Aeromonas sp. 1HA1]|uniref:hypothetical protein n=1 Tax=Aeromonas sp. 1HA1 TaxID=2699193 RepID=UPI0023DE049D|nr:hypothetical protein [Aeromonas sp. 1HA1]
MKALLKKEHKITAGSQGQTYFSWSKNVRDLALGAWASADLRQPENAAFQKWFRAGFQRPRSLVIKDVRSLPKTGQLIIYLHRLSPSSQDGLITIGNRYVY